MAKGDGKKYLCRYQVPMLIFMLKGERLEMNPTNIISIEKIDDYERNIRSIIKISLRIDTRRKLWLLKNKREISCKFELDKVGMDTETEAFTVGTESVWNLEFNIYFNDEDETTDTKALEERIKANEPADSVNNIQEESYFESENQLDVYLFHSKMMNASNKTFNGVFTEAIMQDIIGRIVTETKHPKVLMSPIENDEVYKELLVPANPAYKCFIYLDQYYGFYKDGAIIYYDLDTLYILNSNGKLTAKRPGEWSEVVFLIDQLDGAFPGNGMQRKPGEEKYYVNINETNINPKKYSETTNEKVGSSAKIVMTDDIEIDEVYAEQSTMGQTNECIKYADKDSSKYSSSIITARMEENDCVMYINAENLDLEAFTPNKTYKLIFTETSKQEKYGKFSYRLAYAYHFIEKESTEFMISSHRFMLKKCASN